MKPTGSNRGSARSGRLGPGGGPRRRSARRWAVPRERAGSDGLGRSRSVERYGTLSDMPVAVLVRLVQEPYQPHKESIRSKDSPCADRSA
jgi:hypothetical protein